MPVPTIGDHRNAVAILTAHTRQDTGAVRAILTDVIADGRVVPLVLALLDVYTLTVPALAEPHGAEMLAGALLALARSEDES
jgi:hypothetical protein